MGLTDMTPEDVRRANTTRYQEYPRMVKLEKKLIKKLLEELGPRPAIPELVLRPNLPESQTRNRCRSCEPCKAPAYGACRPCHEEGRSITRVRNMEGEDSDECQSEQRRCMTWPKPPPSPSSSWGASSLASAATAENLLAGTGELKDRQDKLSRATAALIVAVKEAGGGQWDAEPGLTEEALRGWLGEQEDRIEDPKERLDLK